MLTKILIYFLTTNILIFYLGRYYEKYLTSYHPLRRSMGQKLILKSIEQGSAIKI